MVPVKLLNLDHVAIAVHDLDAAVEGYRIRYGVEPLHREVVEQQGVEEAMIPVGGSFVQLLQPLSPDTPVGRFLAKRGEGLHHVAYAVPDIEKALAHLESEGARLVDQRPRNGGGGRRIAFVHPADLAGTLIELGELSDGWARRYQRRGRALRSGGRGRRHRLRDRVRAQGDATTAERIQPTAGLGQGATAAQSGGPAEHHPARSLRRPALTSQ